MADYIGQRFGNYLLQRLLGEGGFAEVYLGEHIHLGSQAAIKVLNNRLGQDDQENFRNEARTIVRLRHPNVVRLLEFGIEGSVPFLVMDYAPNGTLRERHLKGQPVPLATILPYVRQVADALQYAHEQKLVHRDIKPENMLIGERNEVLLSDFGISTIAQSSRYQGTQEVAGTAAYMAPEQIKGHPRAASDQYSLGIVVYEWLTGARPFHGAFHELASQHLFASPPPLREKLPTLSPPVEQVVLTALEKDPQQRFASVRAFATALEQASLLDQPTQLSSAPLAVSPSVPLPSPLTASAPASADSPPTVQAQRPPVEAPTERPAKTMEERMSASFPSSSASTSFSAPPASFAANPAPPRRRRRVVLLSALVGILLTGSILGLVAAGNGFFTSSRTITAQQSQSQTVNATGQTTTPATHASGTVYIDNFDTTGPITLQSGSTYSNTYGTVNIHMVLDATVTVPAAPSTTAWSQRSAPGHILEVGPIGNNEFNSNEYGALSYSVFNNPPFSNGQDAQTSTVVQQSDIDTAANSLKAATRQSAVADLDRQVQSNEHLVGDPQCTYFVNSDHVAGDSVSSVTVTVHAVCTATAST